MAEPTTPTLESRVKKLESKVGSVEALEGRIAELDDVVRKLRSELDELAGEPPGPKWHQSGKIHPELDDQTIAP
jgi:hypothetical protein